MDLETEKPVMWAGHVNMSTDKIDESEAFMLAVGMRPLFRRDDTVILEMRAGTHLVISLVDKVEPGPAAFDLMVEDLDAFHARLTDAGLNPSEIGPVPAHQAFTLTEPAGNVITVFDSHNSEFPV
ncbi:MAG: glyoxalase/bleomycin resistance/dioxygenase family protein [Alphaproteobacteria bacterium]|nr:MAG: glyoxalase/bleomycin resistance/dioxygenase family protein [Alphaproteobacteria bacterium]